MKKPKRDTPIARRRNIVNERRSVTDKTSHVVEYFILTYNRSSRQRRIQELPPKTLKRKKSEDRKENEKQVDIQEKQLGIIKRNKLTAGGRCTASCSST